MNILSLWNPKPCFVWNGTVREAVKEAVIREIDLSGALLTGVDLSNLDLSIAHLHRADLGRANLKGTNLQSADLSGANLAGADLAGAVLYRTNLSGAFIRDVDLLFHVPSCDHRGYTAYGCKTSGEWLLHAGCHVFTLDQAKQHWGKPLYLDRRRGDDYLNITIPYFEEKICNDS